MKAVSMPKRPATTPMSAGPVIVPAARKTCVALKPVPGWSGKTVEVHVTRRALNAIKLDPKSAAEIPKATQDIGAAPSTPVATPRAVRVATKERRSPSREIKSPVATPAIPVTPTAVQRRGPAEGGTRRRGRLGPQHRSSTLSQ